MTTTTTVQLTLPQIAALLEMSERGLDDLATAVAEDGYDATGLAAAAQTLTDAGTARAALTAATVAVRIENTYSDGHTSTVHVTVLAPLCASPANASELEAWWEDHVSPLTGDGHGANRDVTATYEATITRAAAPALVGQSYDWEG